MRRLTNGFTLLEVLIVVSIATVISSLLVVILANTAGLFYKESAKIGQGVSANDALSKFRQVVKESNSVASSYPEDSSPIFVTSGTLIVLKVPSIDSDGDIIPSIFDYFVFLKDQDRLKLKIFPNAQSLRSSQGQDQILSSKVENLIFEYYDSQTPPQPVQPQSAVRIRMSLILKQKSGADFEESIATSEANLRND